MIKSYKGNSLVVTVVISLVLAIICSSIILLAYYNRRQQLKYDIEARLQRNVESATNLILADPSVYSSPVSDTIDLFDEGKDSLEIKKELWGIFQVATINAFHNRVSRQKSFFYGPAMPDYMNACLYVANHRRPVAAVGDTKLIGDGYLPGEGIISSYIGQRGFENNKLIEGEIKHSQDSLPDLNIEVLKNLRNLLSGNPINYSRFTGDSMEQDFSDTALYIHSQEKISLSRCCIKGHIQIKSDIGIDVDSSAHLNNIMLVAPYVRFKEGSRATVQVLASDSLVIEGNCVFEYPSTLILQKGNNSTIQNKLSIGENCIIEGIVLSICNNKDLYKSFVTIGASTKIVGVIRAMGYLALKGSIDGIAMTDFFIYRSPTTTYENYLVDITIDRTRLPGYFFISSIFNSSMPRGIIQWVK